ncbi:MAG TPA: FHA domain-containing protein [Kofleriaceae bacterium]|jgi:hypothetical protein|nr:FHA domain-containing protein [Kofleriaceae bacterium]
MGCLCCGATLEVGALCRNCAHEVEPCEGLIPDHIRSKIDTTDAEAWLVDGFGGAHAVGPLTTIGRNFQGDLMVLASSVSREHVELSLADGVWSVRDLGSRNGTWINGARLEGRMVLPARAQLKIGDVLLWFLSEIVHEPPRRPTMATGEAGGALVRYQLAHRDSELCVVAGMDAEAAGAILWRPTGAADWSERGLAPLEFQLLRVLCARAQEESTSPSAVRGCVPTKQLVRELPFQSKYANEENVRQVVLRLRGALSEVGVAGMLAVAPGRGYYLACKVSTSATRI